MGRTLAPKSLTTFTKFLKRVIKHTILIGLFGYSANVRIFALCFS